LDGERISSDLVERWLDADEPVLLLNIPKNLIKIPRSVRRYLESPEGQLTRSGYKCSHREPWYSVPDVHVPEFFLSYLSGRRVTLARNEAGLTCTNALHYVRLKDRNCAGYVAEAWRSPFTQLSCEVEGHPLGGGVLKLEPREASSILLSSVWNNGGFDERDIADGIAALQSWRHYC
jgi:hypothetical protein